MAQRPEGKRSPPARKRNNPVIIVVEGKTEKEYFKAYRKKHRLHTVKVKDNRTRTSPLQIVEDLVKEKKDDSRLEFVAVFDHRKEKGSNTDDDIYHKAIKLCQKEKFIAITSKPSFEFWFLLHFIETDRKMSAEEAEKELKIHYENQLKKEYKKGDPDTFENTSSRLFVAIERAEKIWKKEKERASSQCSSRKEEKRSYTNVHELINILTNVDRKGEAYPLF